MFVDETNCMTTERAIKKLSLLKMVAINAGTETEEAMNMAIKALKKRDERPLRCKECSWHRKDGWCTELRKEVKETDYCSFGAWEGDDKA